MKPLEVIEALRLGKEVECKYLDDTWAEYKQTSPVGILTSTEYSFRIKPVEMVTIGDVCFPKPESSPLRMGTIYFYPNTIKADLVDWFKWTDDELDFKLLKANMVHLSKENAIAHAKALIKLSGGSYE
ncbi:hypothetical protein [Moraxella bovis]|uniref:DUF2591 domain-containing protein n=1 Tax=Moraxella bovis TaxID=476 RepID=A0ABY6M884_MORBO|nr:hypothetical protein [Moraxella bovis]UZA02937.1 hypothetical protein LP092_13530 [Moraxella bovis]UZA54030.1 hypothetical protein LP111_12745 [Moraxella bovis]UZA57364.1 hypothetical protein LP127_01430 [Moraxella bovis]